MTDKIIQATQKWVETVVIDLNLCPFAQQEWLNNRVRCTLSSAQDSHNLLQDLSTELFRLQEDDSIETTLLIHPHVLSDFIDYNQFLELADQLLVQLKMLGTFQIASFHPDYQFADTKADDVENYTNRSPYPMLHLIREQSLQAAIAAYPDVDEVPARNIQKLKQIGLESMQRLLSDCLP